MMLTHVAQGQIPIEQDCALANTIWLKMGQSTPLASYCCGTNGITCAITKIKGKTYGRITQLSWQFYPLRGSIPPEIGNLTALEALFLGYQNLANSDTQLTGTIPGTLGNLVNLTALYLDNNKLTGPIPESLGNLKKLEGLSIPNNQLTGPLPSFITSLTSLRMLDLKGNQLTGSIPANIGDLTQMGNLVLAGNQFSGPIPESITKLIKLGFLNLGYNQLSGPIPGNIGDLKSLSYLYLNNNNLTGYIPSSMGALTGAQYLYLQDNQLTGFPAALSSMSRFSLRIFPNPMSDIPYDFVKPLSLGILSSVTVTAFMNTPVTNLKRKRQFLSGQAPVTTDELIAMCPLNNVFGQDVAAGCIAGVYYKYCSNPWDSDLLSQCHDVYNRVFAASIFKSLGEVCPAWKKGPLSASCASAIRSFSYSGTLSGYQVQLGPMHAQELVKTIIGQPRYAPCQAPFACNWEMTAD
jgi:Leucine-rich repeat (LRR) protein